MSSQTAHPHTPDGRYFVVRGRLWRLANPGLPPELRASLVIRLMDARRSLKAGTSDLGVRTAARYQVHAAKVALGERGPVWWTDGAPDYNRKFVRDTPYADWFATIGQQPLNTIAG